MPGTCILISRSETGCLTADGALEPGKVRPYVASAHPFFSSVPKYRHFSNVIGFWFPRSAVSLVLLLGAAAAGFAAWRFRVRRKG